jgi:hypothetical protein
LTIVRFDHGPPGTYEICPVCWWEDDLVESREPERHVGANRQTLSEARAAFDEWRKNGMPEDGRRRKPRTEERPTGTP